MPNNEKPILFSTPMVQAILEGKKTQTRRVVNAPEYAYYKQGGLVWYDPEQNQDTKRCPRYQSGDILWVRETFFCEPCTFDCAGQIDDNECPFNRVNYKCYGYKAQYTNGEGDLKIKWRPSIHMPREAARIFLHVTDVRVERLQDISDKDSRAEGVVPIEIDVLCNGAGITYFRKVWDNINAKRGYDWKTNPWVWIYEFERIED